MASTLARQRRIASGGEIFQSYFPDWQYPTGALVMPRCRPSWRWPYDANSFGAKLVALSKQIRPDGMTRVRAFLDQT